MEIKYIQILRQKIAKENASYKSLSLIMLDSVIGEVKSIILKYF